MLRLLSIPILLLALIPVPAAAESADAYLVEEARKFVAAYPEINKAGRSPRDVIELWRRIDGLTNLVTLARRDKLPSDLIPQLHRRLNVHMGFVPALVKEKDPLITGLAEIVAAHANAADLLVRSRVGDGVYGSVADLAVSHGHFLAWSASQKYAKGLVEKWEPSGW